MIALVMLGLGYIAPVSTRVICSSEHGFTGLLSIANLAGRCVWSSISDIIGRRMVYAVYFLVGGLCCAPASHAAKPEPYSIHRVDSCDYQHVWRLSSARCS